MKKTQTLIAIGSRYSIATIAAFVLLIFCCNAQITLTYTNYLVPPAEDHFLQGADPAGVALPSLGTDQAWDYSNLVSNDAYNNSYLSVPPANPAFAGARTQSDFIGYIAGIPILQTRYDADDITSFRRMGESLTRQAFSIGAITGSSTDSLVILEQDVPDEGTFTYVPYPCTYQTSWSSTVRVPVNYELSIAAFGLDHVPGQFVQLEQQSREVVGSGKLRIPLGSGTSDNISVLLFKTTYINIDSVYLGGAPADPLLLAAFGITQGGLFGTEYAYEFRRKGIEENLLYMNLDETFTAINFLNYDAHTADIYCNARSVKLCHNGDTRCVKYANANAALQTPNTTVGDCGLERFSTDLLNKDISFAVIAFPNPTDAEFTIQIKGTSGIISQVRIVDLSGKLIEQFNTAEQTVRVGGTLLPGIYFAEVLNGNEKQTLKIIKTN